MKKFIAGVLVGLLLIVSASVFAATMENISVAFGQIKLVVDGQPVDKETLFYNGTTYVPLKAVSEMFGKTITYDNATQTAHISSSAVASVPTIQPVAQPPAQNPNTPITIEQISHELRALPANSIGRIYMETEVTNNSSYAIKGFSLTVLDKQTNETSFLMNYDTVLPGETSPTFNGFGPTSGNISDIQILETEIVVVTSTGENVYVTYDHKLNTYNVLGNWQ